MAEITVVDFHGQQLLAVHREGKVLIAVRPIAEGMGLEWSSQLQRIKRDTILSEAVVMITTPFSRHGQEEACLPLEIVNGWLFQIDDSRVKEEARETVLTYKRECYDVLHRHFYAKALARADAGPLEPADGVGNEGHKLRHVAEVRLTFGHKAAQQIYFKLGLDVVPAMLEPDPQRGLFDPDRPGADSQIAEVA